MTLKQKPYHQNKNPISINDTDINKIVVSNERFFGKQHFQYFIGYKDSKKIDLYPYSLHKWLYIKEILMKIDAFIF